MLQLAIDVFFARSNFLQRSSNLSMEVVEICFCFSECGTNLLLMTLHLVVVHAPVLVVRQDVNLEHWGDPLDLQPPRLWIDVTLQHGIALKVAGLSLQIRSKRPPGCTHKRRYVVVVLLPFGRLEIVKIIFRLILVGLLVLVFNFVGGHFCVFISLSVLLVIILLVYRPFELDAARIYCSIRQLLENIAHNLAVRLLELRRRKVHRHPHLLQLHRDCRDHHIRIGLLVAGIKAVAALLHKKRNDGGKRTKLLRGLWRRNRKVVPWNGKETVLLHKLFVAKHLQFVENILHHCQCHVLRASAVARKLCGRRSPLQLRRITTAVIVFVVVVHFFKFPQAATLNDPNMRKRVCSIDRRLC
eukprot:Opistho-2@85812